MLANKSALVLLYKSAHIIYPDIEDMCETANIENIAVKVHILFTPTREYMRNSKHLTYGYKVHIWFSPTWGYLRNK